MEDFRVIYRILKVLHDAMDYEVFDRRLLDAKVLGISELKRNRLLCMLLQEGYITGIELIWADGADAPIYINLRSPSLTMKGLEYLDDNSLMKKAAAMAKGIVDAAAKLI